MHGIDNKYSKQLALEGVSFEISKGEIVGFIGPNGAGKSTTMKIITGYIPPTYSRKSKPSATVLSLLTKVKL